MVWHRICHSLLHGTLAGVFCQNSTSRRNQIDLFVIEKCKNDAKYHIVQLDELIACYFIARKKIGLKICYSQLKLRFFLSKTVNCH